MTCPQCFGAGWVLDAKVDMTPTTLELIPCIIPDCEWSGRDVAVLCLYGEWDRPVLHPVTGAVMSLSQSPVGKRRFGRCEDVCPCATVIAETPSMRTRRETLAEDIVTMLERHGTVAAIRMGHRGGWQDALVECREDLRDSVIPWDKPAAA